MRKLLFAFVLLTGMLSVNSCSTDFDLYADYQDITIVYGLLDISDDTSWIKITKAFTGPGNALVIAQNPDSSNYPYKLDVRLVGVKNGNPLSPIVLDTLTIHNKQAGDSVFYYPDQLVYYTPEELDPAATYSLLIDNKGKEIKSETPLVGDFYISRPNKVISFTSNGAIEWDLAPNGKRYEVTLFFHYKELGPGAPDTVYKVMRWYLGTDTENTGSQGYSGDTFFSMLTSELDVVPNLKRWAGEVVIEVACGSEILNSYIEINQADNSLLTEVPVFSNIEGGTGVFASRHTVYKSAELSSYTITVLVDQYPELGFQRPTR